jgi:hypothetical protein
MGFIPSKPYHTKPSNFATKVEPASATPVTQEEALKEYKSYDYVIVGAGALHVNKYDTYHRSIAI